MPYHQTPSGSEWFFSEEGSGEAVVFLHGWGVDSRIWQQQVSSFSDRFRVVVMDLPGHGRSSWRPMGLDDIASAGLGLLDSLGVTAFHSVASSLGGLVALKIQDLAPSRMASLALVGSHPKFVASPDYPYGLKKAQTRRLACQLKTDYPQILEVFFRSLFTVEEREGPRYRWMRSFKASEAVAKREALDALLRELETADLRENLKRVACPVVFLNGVRDTFFPRELESYWRSWLPRARFEWFEGCGHFPFITKPVEFNLALERFWEEGGPGHDR